MSNRLEREIEEILQQAEMPPAAEKAQKGGGQRADSGSFRVQDSLRPKRFFIVAGLLALSWLVLNAMGLGLAGVLGWLALVLFIAGYALYFVRSESTPQRRWRGQVVDYGDRSSWRSRLRRWLH
jgi:hypothetical protein